MEGKKQGKSKQAGSNSQKKSHQRQQNDPAAAAKRAAKRQTGEAAVKEMPHLMGKSVDETLKSLQVAKEEKRKRDDKRNKENQNSNQRKTPDTQDVKRAFGVANMILEEVYTATSTQRKKMEVLRPYSSFAQPEFYQPPEWQWRRSANRNQNCKQKYYTDDVAAFDAVMSKPAPAQSSEDQKMKPKQEYKDMLTKSLEAQQQGSESSNDDADEAWQSSSGDEFEINDDHLDVDNDDFDQVLHVTQAPTGRVKKDKKHQKLPGSDQSFDKKKARTEKMKKMADYRKQEREIFQDDFDIKKSKTVKKEHYDFKNGGRKNQKNQPKGRPVQNVQKKGGYTNTATKAYDESPNDKQPDFDMKREKRIANKVFSQGKGKIEHRAKEKSAKEQRNGQSKAKIYEMHLTDQKEITQRLEKGQLFEGMIRFNPKFRQRAFLTVKELKVDIMIEGQTKMNRSMDGDTVLVQLDAVRQWQELRDKHQQNSVIGKGNTGKSKEKGYSNSQAIETRTVDQKHSEKDNSQNIEQPVTKEEKKKTEIENESEVSLEEVGDEDDMSWQDCDSEDSETTGFGKTVEKKEEVKERIYHIPAAKTEVKKKEQNKKGRKDDSEKTELPEITGSREERIAKINQVSQTHRPQGRVIGIKHSPNREKEQMCTLVGLAAGGGKQKKKSKKKPQEEEMLMAMPVNSKLPWYDLTSIPPQVEEDKQAEKKVGHRYYIAKFKEWTVSQRRPVCEVIESIGEAGNLDAESMRLLRTYDICTEAYEDENEEPTSNVDESLKIFAKDIDPKTKEWIIPQSEIDKRLDLRSKRIFTIDPLTAKDLDDALSIDKISDHVYEIGVHIADVSYFVMQGTALDHEAQKRCTSTYFVHKVYPMLPRLLCERLCSLNPQVDRLAYSVFFRMDIRKGELDPTHEPRMCRSVIRSCAKWNYELVQRVLDRQVTKEDELDDAMRPLGQRFEDMVSDCFLMNEIAQKRREKRLETGSVMFMNREFTFMLDPESKHPLEYCESRKMQSKSLVEEYMLLANVLVAKQLLKYCKDKTVLRAHNDITADKKERLNEFFQKIGLKGIDLTNASTLSHSMERLKLTESKDTMDVLNRKFLTCLTQAKYVTVDDREPEEYLHYGLNFPIYTHFTSPIRRYADLLVHRLLTISLKEGEKTRKMIENIDYAHYADLCSEKSLNARKAGKDCQRLFHCLLLKQEGPQVLNGLVFDVDAQSISVYIEEINIHQTMKLKDDPRVESTEFFGEGEDLMVACMFKKPLACAPGLSNYMTRKKRDNAKEDKAPLSNVCFKVYDRIQLKVGTTTDFPLDLKLSLLLTEKDVTEAEEIQSQRQADQTKKNKVVQIVNDQPV